MQASDIIQRQFIIKGGRIRHCTPQEHASARRENGEKAFTCFSIFIPAFDPEATKQAFEQRAFRDVDVHTSQDPAGVYLLAGYWWLEKVVEAVSRSPIES